VVGFVVAIPALFMNLTMVTDLCSIGTLFAFVLVCGGVLALQNKTDVPRGKFKTPYVNGKYVLPFLVIGGLILGFTTYKNEVFNFVTNKSELKETKDLIIDLTQNESDKLKNNIATIDKEGLERVGSDLLAYFEQAPKVDLETTQLTTLEKRLKYWGTTNPFGLTLDFLKEIFTAKIEDEIFFVKFEDFCRFPEPVMRSLYKYLEIPYFAHDFNNIIQVTDQNDGFYIFNHKIRKEVRPVKPKAIDIMGIDACNWVYDTYEWFFKKFNYEK
jgi:hypothetical protein